eukprot:4191376-Prorocentrum_lima.AAC.1
MHMVQTRQDKGRRVIQQDLQRMYGTHTRRKETNKGRKGRRRERTGQEHLVAEKKSGRSTE